MSKQQKTTSKRDHYTVRNMKQKRAMIDAMEKSLGIVTTACKFVGIERSTHYGWLKADGEYREAIESLDDMVLDFAESQLHKQIKAGNTASTIFFLKCKGKKRGYVENNDKESKNITISLPKGVELEIEED